MQTEAEHSRASSARTEPAIDVVRLVVDRGGRRVLREISCTVPRGSVVGLIGPSGSGKTTLMRCVVGVQKVRSGRVAVLGQEAGSAELRRRVGYMTQAPSVYADLSVIENARYFAALYGLGESEANEAIVAVDLGRAKGQLVGTLSGGQRARASLACALLGKPELLVLDEPTVGQDPVLREDLWSHFYKMASEGTTLLVSSHVMNEARRCDRLLVIHEGRLIGDDTPEAIRSSTGADDLDDAFLALIRRENEEAK